jgi:hypothetical protein
MKLHLLTLAGFLFAGTFTADAQAQNDQTCTVTTGGPGCGPTLTGIFRAVGGHHQLELRMDNGFPQEHGMWIFGSADFSWQIPNTQCFLYTNFVYGHGFMTDATGTATLQRSWVAHHIGPIRLQAASYRIRPNTGEFEVRTANLIIATCTE